MILIHPWLDLAAHLGAAAFVAYAVLRVRAARRREAGARLEGRLSQAQQNLRHITDLEVQLQAALTAPLTCEVCTTEIPIGAVMRRTRAGVRCAGCLGPVPEP